MKIKYKCKIKSIEHVQVGDWIWSDEGSYNCSHTAKRVLKIDGERLYIYMNTVGLKGSISD